MITARRVVTVTAVVLVELAVLAAAPTALPAAAVVSLVTRSSRPLRSVALVTAYAGIELLVLARMWRGVADWDELARQVVDLGYATMRRILGVSVSLEAGSAGTAELHGGRGVIVLARHCGPGDSLFIGWLLVVHHELTIRVVLKRALRAEPTLDLAGDHMGLCFVGGIRRRSLDGVGRVAASLGPGDALLLFPEGRNFSWDRWRSAIDRLVAAGAIRRARRARRHTHTLPPHLGGALAALQAAPDADVLLLAHSGLSSDGRDRPWWRLPVRQQLLVRTLLFPAADVPRDPPAFEAFLDDAWARVDTWVKGHADLVAASGQPPSRRR